MLNDNIKLPLISVIVITYNSRDYVIETLESVKMQSYQNIQLIISDDFSKDDTVQVINQWLKSEENIRSFASVKFLANTKNSGVSGNCNVALRVCEGEWIKIIAGDDVLFPNCIQTFVDAAIQNQNVKIMVSMLTSFRQSVDQPVSVWPKYKFPTTLKRQLEQQIKGGFIKAPAVFINRATLDNFGGFDENYPFLEDDPMWLKFLQNQYPFYFIERSLVGYRLHDMAISNGSSGGYINPLFFGSYSKFKIEKVFPLMKSKKMFFIHILSRWELDLQTEIVNNGNLKEQISLYQKIAFKVISIGRKFSNIFN